LPDRSQFQLFFDHLYLQDDVHIISDCNAAGFKSRIPDQTKVLAIDFGGGRGAFTDIALPVFSLN
jgi:hypothetical protein